MTDSDRIAARVDKTIDYMNSAKGNAAWFANESRGLSARMNFFDAIQKATRISKYEDMDAVFNALGPALNARRASKTA